MPTFFAEGSPTTDLSPDDVRAALFSTFEKLGPRRKVLALPSDFTRVHGMGGQLTCLTYEYFGDRLSDVMPALGSHSPMADWQIERMFPSVPRGLIREHDWRNDVVTIGEVPADFVCQATGGLWTRPWPAQLNRLVWEGGHDLVLSIGQVVPHEVMGMANYNKNIFVGCGGSQAINPSHFIGAAYGMERMMGRADTPVRRILNYAQDHFCSKLPLVFALTVIGARDDASLALRGLYIGSDVECFLMASELSMKVNFTVLDEAPQKMVVYLDPEEFHSTWVGNKAVYRTRMAMADGGELLVLAPGVRMFGEDPQIDVLIRKYGYHGTPKVMQWVRESEDLPQNLSAAAHLIHGSSEGRFRITYCPGHLSREEIESVGYGYADLDAMLKRYEPGAPACGSRRDGWATMPDGERIYFIGQPALGLWAHPDRMG